MKKLVLLSIFLVSIIGCVKHDPMSDTNPVISSINPAKARIGTVISIFGKNFGLSQAGNYVTFDGINATEYIIWHDNEIRVTVPAEVRSGKVWVNVYGTASNEVDFNLIVITYGEMSDKDGNKYKTVKIGDQTWMAENLNVTHFKNGDKIRNAISFADWESIINNKEAAYSDINNISDSGKIYGKLYNWYAVSDSRSLAPEGWHIPSYNDWNTLISYLGDSSQAGTKLKETGSKHWMAPNYSSTDEYGFTALPGGSRNFSGSFFQLGSVGCWWSSSEFNVSISWFMSLESYGTYVLIDKIHKGNGFSVRCIKDN